MFETAELGQEISKSEYKEQVPVLREALLLAQSRLINADFPVIVLFAGVDGAGKSETTNLLNEWMDPRWLVTHAFDEPTQEERERPEYWRFWRALPPRGRIGILLKAWYSRPLLDRVYGGSSGDFDSALEEIHTFERTLTDGGAVILKFWMHLGKKVQKRRLQALAKDPLQSWRVTEKDWANWKRYDGFVEAAERLIAHTNTGAAPWHIVEGRDLRYRSLRVGSLLLAALEKHLEADWQANLAKRAPIAPPAAPDAATPLPAVAPIEGTTILSRLDSSKTLQKSDYSRRLKKLQGRLNGLQRSAREHGISTIAVFEGWDAAGKGGAIRRITRALDARFVQTISVSAPTDEERAHHYLWRFWRHLPRAGRVTLFDRSWYGRVLVERVEGFASEEAWHRAYAEINLFEQQLVRHGTVLLKFWLHIDPEEQLERFKARAEIPFKRWKLTDEDWRNRDKWGAYEAAVHDMVQQTSTRAAPWVLVEANDKRFARVKVLDTLCDALEQGLSETTSGAGKTSKGERRA